MFKNAVEILEKYIAGKDQDQFQILEKIYSENAKVSFEINSETISFPQETHGNKEIAQVLSAEFNKNYDNVKTYYLSNGFPEIEEQVISNQSWLVIMRDKKNNHVRVGTGHYDWLFEKQSNSELKIKKHHIFIGVMLSLADFSLENLHDLQKKLAYPWVGKEKVSQVLDGYVNLREIKEYLQKQ